MTLVVWPVADQLVEGRVSADSSMKPAEFVAQRASASKGPATASEEARFAAKAGNASGRVAMDAVSGRLVITGVSVWSTRLCSSRSAPGQSTPAGLLCPPVRE